MSMVVAVVGACAKVASGTLVARVAVASTIVAISFVVTIVLANQK